MLKKVLSYIIPCILSYFVLVLFMYNDCKTKSWVYAIPIILFTTLFIFVLEYFDKKRKK